MISSCMCFGGVNPTFTGLTALYRSDHHRSYLYPKSSQLLMIISDQQFTHMVHTQGSSIYLRLSCVFNKWLRAFILHGDPNTLTSSYSKSSSLIRGVSTQLPCYLTASGHTYVSSIKHFSKVATACLAWAEFCIVIYHIISTCCTKY